MMKKLLFTLSILFYSFCNAQVGIGTTAPSATVDIVSKDNTSSTKALEINNSSSLETVTVTNSGNVGINNPSPETDALLELKSTNKALLITRVPNVSAIAHPVNGMILYDISGECIRSYENNSWTACWGSIAGTISSLDCSGVTNSGTLTENTAASSVSSSISYTGGNGGSFSSFSVTSTGVTGLTATINAGSFASGSGSLTIAITGTPSGAGTAYFILDIGGQSCTLSRTVNTSITIPNSITLAQNKVYMVVSVYDKDYLPYTTPTAAATATAIAADGTNETATANYQGTITTTGITVRIPATATASGTLPAFSTTITIPANLTEDNTSRNLTLSWASQAFTSSTNYITATIASVSSTLNAKKLDINSGVGNDYLGILLGTFNYPYNNAGNTTTYQVRDFPGIPDKMFGKTDNNGSTTSHLMLYHPIDAEDGKTWLNNNLGAQYSNISLASFNPTMQATSFTDFLAYGSLFQWGRKSDGHELITFTGATTGTSANGTTSTLNNSPTTALLILNASGTYDWRSTQDDTLWAAESSTNNPCPSGYRVPTSSELTNLITAAGITNSTTSISSALKFSAAGGRDGSNGNLSATGGYGNYMSSTASTVTSGYSFSRLINAATTNLSVNRASGFTVRCIKN